MTAAASLMRVIAVALALVLLVLLARRLGIWIEATLTPLIAPQSASLRDGMVAAALLVYVLLMALPFVPGAEIGLSLMMVFGAKVAPVVYAATVLALALAFLVGHLVPGPTIARALRGLHLTRAAALLDQLEGMGPEGRLDFLLQNSGSRALPWALRYRYLALMAALNLPGNVVIGGGGGICLVAGFSRLFRLPAFLLAVALGVAPVPLLMMIPF